MLIWLLLLIYIPEVAPADCQGFDLTNGNGWLRSIIALCSAIPLWWAPVLKNHSPASIHQFWRVMTLSTCGAAVADDWPKTTSDIRFSRWTFYWVIWFGWTSWRLASSASVYSSLAVSYAEFWWVIPVRSSAHLFSPLYWAYHAPIEQKIHLFILLRFPWPPLSVVG